MAGIRGRSGPPRNQNAFRYGLAGVSQRRADGALNPAEQSAREEILSGLLSDKRGSYADQYRYARAGGDYRERCSMGINYVRARLSFAHLAR